MFLHIGNNYIIKKEEIIGIYNIKSIKNTKEYKKIIENLKKNNNLIKIENNEEKTLIITENSKIVKGYICNVSSTTIANRLKNTIKLC